MKRLVLFGLMMMPVVVNAELEQEDKIKILANECIQGKDDEACKVFCNSVALKQPYIDDSEANKLFSECRNDAKHCAAFREYIIKMSAKMNMADDRIRTRLKELDDEYLEVKREESEVRAFLNECFEDKNDESCKAFCNKFPAFLQYVNNAKLKQLFLN